MHSRAPKQMTMLLPSEMSSGPKGEKGGKMKRVWLGMFWREWIDWFLMNPERQDGLELCWRSIASLWSQILI